MKRLVTFIMLITLVTSSVFAQETLSSIVRDYQRHNSEFTFVIPTFLIKIGLVFGDMNNKDSEVAILNDKDREILEMLEDMKIVVSENPFNMNDFTALEDGIRNGDFVEVMRAQERDERVRMIMNHKSKNKSEMLMIVENNVENVLMLFDFYGEPDFKKFMALTD